MLNSIFYLLIDFINCFLFTRLVSYDLIDLISPCFWLVAIGLEPILTSHNFYGGNESTLSYWQILGLLIFFVFFNRLLLRLLLSFIILLYIHSCCSHILYLDYISNFHISLAISILLSSTA